MFFVDPVWIRWTLGVIAVINIIGHMYYASLQNSLRREALTRVATGEGDEEFEETD